mmetsp:Transcript_46776/g.57461  ORF Transcript_46776/g.57461 Transcript_46776/m.57461 type:complete len:85 (+) Transcript_46776:159-413(+)
MVMRAWAKPAPPKPPMACQLIISMKPAAGLSPGLSKRVGLMVLPKIRPPIDTIPTMAQPHSKPTVAASGVFLKGPKDVKGPIKK